MGALAPLNMFNTMLRAPLLQYCEIGALSYERTSMAPYPITRLMLEVGPLASQMLSMQVYLKGAPASVLGRWRRFMRNRVNGTFPMKMCDA